MIAKSSVIQVSREEEEIKKQEAKGSLKINKSDVRDLDQHYNIQMWLQLNYGRGFSEIPSLVLPSLLFPLFLLSFLQEALDILLAAWASFGYSEN